MEARAARRASRKCSSLRATPAPRASRSSPTSRHSAIADLVAFAKTDKVALTVVGPGGAAGCRHRRRVPRRGPADLRPTKAAAQLESSKDYAKAFMARHGIPTARVPDVHRRRRGPRLRRGAAARRSSSRRTASRQARASSWRRASPKRTRPSTRCCVGNAFGAAGARVVVEEFLAGEEASFIVMADGRHVLPLASSQDHKRLRDATRGRTPAGWARTRRRRWSRRRCTRGSCAR